MKYGVHLFPTATSIQPDELARAAEDRGLDSAWFSEHTHIPVSFLRTPGRGTSLPDYYWQTYDLFIAMTQAAVATTTIKIGSGVALVVERDPILLAKETATLDLISKGRFIFGVGVGWLEPEMADHGVVYRTRYQLLKDQLRAIQAIWSAEESEFHGRFVNFDAMKSFPKPYRQPHPPIIMGGFGDKALELAAELCDGWAPWSPEWSKAKAAIVDLKQRALANERDPQALEISIFVDTLPDQKTIAEMNAAGVRKVILSVHAESREEALPRLDQIAGIM